MFVNDRDICSEFLGGLCTSQLFLKVDIEAIPKILSEYQSRGNWGIVIDQDGREPVLTDSIPYLERSHEKLLFDKLESLLVLKQMCFLENSLRLFRKTISLYSKELTERDVEIRSMLDSQSYSIDGLTSLISLQKKEINERKLEDVPSIAKFLEVCPTCAMMISQSHPPFSGESQLDYLQIQDLILAIFNESLVAIPENSSIDKQLLTFKEHEVREEIHSHWIKIKEKHTELGILYSPDKGQRRSMGSGSK